MSDIQREPAVEPLLDLIFLRANVGLCLVAPDDRVVRANAEWLRATGYALEDVLGASILDLYPVKRDMAAALHARARAGHRVQVPRHAQYVNGQETLWDGTIEPVAMPAGTGLLITATEHKRAEEQLKRDSETFYHLIRNNPFGIYVVDCDFTLRVVSLGAQKVFSNVRPLLGRDFAEVLRIVWTEPFASDAIARFRHTLETGEAYVATSTVERRADIGDVEAYDWRIERITLPDGRLGVVCYFYDLSERERWELALRSSEERFRALANATWNIVYRMNPDWTELRALDGRGLIADTSGPKTSWLEDYIHPDDHPLVLDAIHEAIRKKAAFELEHRVRRLDGTLGWTLSRAIPLFNDKGEITEWFGAASDVTARKEAEAALRDLVDRHARQVRLFEGIASTTPDFVYLFDLQGRFQYANRRLLDVWGMELPDIVGKTCLELGYERWHHDMHMREIAQVIETRRPIKGEVPFRAPLTGIFGVYEYIFTPVLGPDGAVELIAGTTRDITDRKQAEEALRDADRRKDEFLATLAHELRNPLAPIRNAVALLKHPELAEHGRRAAQVIIERQVDHMVRLIDDLLEVSRITRGKLELRKETVTLRNVLEQALETSRPHIGQELTVVMPPEAVYLHADPIRLAQLFSNLLNNASKYTPGDGRIHVSAMRDGMEVVVKVADTGIGISQDHLPRVFDMFFQATPTLERAGSGLGIGLALARGLVEMHGGSITANSAGPGKGSEFVVRLPCLAQMPGAPAAAPETKAVGGLHARRILVVEDNEDAAESLAMLLKLAGADVELVHDGREAVQKASDYQPDAILLDIGLPSLDGYEVCRAIRAGAPARSTAIVALTGWGQEDDVRKAKQAGFDDHLVKPVDHAALLQLLAALLPAP